MTSRDERPMDLASDLVRSRGPGAITPSGSRRTSALRKAQRLERRILVSKLKIAMASGECVDEDVRACLQTLRAGLTAAATITDENGNVLGEAPNFRERRLSAEAIVDFHLRAAQLTDKAAPETTVTVDNRQQVVQIPPDWLTDPRKRAAALALTDMVIEGGETKQG